MHQVVEKDHVVTARLLLNENTNADINKQDRYEETALHRVASCGHVEMVELLVSRGADTSALNIDVNYQLPSSHPFMSSTLLHTTILSLPNHLLTQYTL